MIIYNIVYPMILILLYEYLAVNYFKGDKSITSSYYYVIVLIPFFIFTNIITMAYVAKDESLSKTAYGFLSAPIDNSAIVLSKIISCTVISWGCSLILLIISKVLLNVNFEGSTLKILILFFTENFMAASIGIFLGIAMKNFKTIKGILNIPISIFGVLGGCFFPVGSLGRTFEKVSYISPFTWINRGIISEVYDKSQTILVGTILVTLVFGIIFSIVASILFNKEVFL
ncbi:membrane protein [Clostridium acetobutylicum]|nr:membrane protein [Clostridium acetobutylicum]